MSLFDVELEEQESLELLIEFGEILLDQHQFRAAADTWERALTMARALPGEESSLVALVLTRIGKTLTELGHPEAAIERIEQALAVYDGLTGPQRDERAVAGALWALAGAYRSVCDLERAMALYTSAVDLHGQVAGIEHPDTVLMMLGLGRVHFLLGNRMRATELAEQAVSIYDFHPSYGCDHAQTTTALNDLGAIHLASGLTERAAVHFKWAMEGFQRTYGDEHGNVAVVLTNLATVELQRDRPDRALSLLERAAAINAAVLHEDHELAAGTTRLAAICHARLGHHGNAAAHYQRAHRAYHRTFGPDHHLTQECRVQSDLQRAAQISPLHARLMEWIQQWGRAQHDFLLQHQDALLTVEAEEALADLASQLPWLEVRPYRDCLAQSRIHGVVGAHQIRCEATRSSEDFLHWTAIVTDWLMAGNDRARALLIDEADVLLDPRAEQLIVRGSSTSPDADVKEHFDRRVALIRMARRQGVPMALATFAGIDLSPPPD